MPYFPNDEVRTSGAQLITGLKTVQPSSAGSVGLIVRGAVGQNTDLAQWQDSAGINFLSVNQVGALTATRGVYITGPVNNNEAFGHLHCLAGTATSIKAIIVGATGQTADLTQWKEVGGGILAAVQASGQVWSSNLVNGVFMQARNGGTSFQTGLDQYLLAYQGSESYRHSIKSRHNGGSYTYNAIDLFCWDGGLAPATVGQKHVATFDASGVGINIGAIAPPAQFSVFTDVGANYGGTTKTGVIVRAGVAQSGDQQQWQDSAGARVAKVRSDGLMAAPYFRDTTDTGPYLAMSTTQIILVSVSTTVPGFQIRSQSGQTANMQEWSNVNASGLYAAMDFAGRLLVGSGNSNPPYLVCGQNTHPGTMTTSLYVVPGSTGWVGIVVRGLVGQTGDLQQWQDSAGTLLAKVPLATSPVAATDLTRKDYVDAAVTSEVAYAETTTVQALGAVADITNLSITFTVTAGRPVMVDVYVPDIYFSAIGSAGLYLCDAANTVIRQALLNGHTGAYAQGVVSERITAAGTYTRKLRAIQLSGSGTFNQGGPAANLTAYIRASR